MQDNARPSRDPPASFSVEDPYYSGIMFPMVRQLRGSAEKQQDADHKRPRNLSSSGYYLSQSPVMDLPSKYRPIVLEISSYKATLLVLAGTNTFEAPSVNNGPRATKSSKIK